MCAQLRLGSTLRPFWRRFSSRPRVRWRDRGAAPGAGRPRWPPGWAAATSTMTFGRLQQRLQHRIPLRAEEFVALQVRVPLVLEQRRLVGLEGCRHRCPSMLLRCRWRVSRARPQSFRRASRVSCRSILDSRRRDVGAVPTELISVGYQVCASTQAEHSQLAWTGPTDRDPAAASRLAMAGLLGDPWARGTVSP